MARAGGNPGPPWRSCDRTELAPAYAGARRSKPSSLRAKRSNPRTRHLMPNGRCAPCTIPNFGQTSAVSCSPSPAAASRSASTRWSVCSRCLEWAYVLLGWIGDWRLLSPLSFRGGAGGGGYRSGAALEARPHPNPSPKEEGLRMSACGRQRRSNATVSLGAKEGLPTASYQSALKPGKADRCATRCFQPSASS